MTDAVPALLFVTDAKGVLRFSNARFRAYTGLAKAPAPNQGWSQVLHPDERARAAAAWASCLLTGEPYEAEHRFRRHDGAYRWHLCRAEPMRDSYGAVSDWVGTCIDVHERKQGEETRALLASIVAASDDAIVSKTLDGTVRSWNAAAERLFGYAAAEAVGRPVTLIIPPDRRDEERVILDRLARGERIEHFETVRVSKSGRRIEVSLSLSPVLDEEGRVVGAANVIRDITVRKRSERLLREREERYELVLAGADAAIWDWDVPRKRVVYSPRWKQLRGLSEEDVGESEDEWRKGIHPEDVDRVLSAVQAHFEGRTAVFAEEYRVRHKDGHWVWVADRGIAKRNAAGEVVRMAGSETDITPRKRVEAELRRSEADYRQLVQSANSAIIRWKRDGTLTFANEYACRLFGYEREELVGRHVNELVPAEDSQGADLTSLVKEIVAHPDRFRDNINENVASDGRRIWMLWTNRPVYHGAELTEILAIGSDITGLKKAQEALREADQRKDEFLAILGHELRNPLAPLKTGVELLEHVGGRPELLEHVRAMMHRQLRHLLRLVDDLVDVSRISRGRIHLRRTAVDVRELVDAAVELTKPLIDERRHALMLEWPQEPLPLIQGDHERLSQVVANLLSNAAKYTRPGGRIRLRVEIDDPEVVVRVSDDGLGIPPEKRDRIFEMFGQLPEHREHVSGSGLGIGLALSRQLIALHGGSIEAVSEGLGRGSEFIVRLPIGTDGMQPAAPRGAARVDQSTPRRILIVDDNVDAAESLRLALELKGHDVRVVHSGTAALHEAGRVWYEIMLLDIGLPDIDGYEVARRVRDLPRGQDVQLVALTGWGQDEDRHRSNEAGFDHHLTKPVGESQLQALLAVASD